jgi:hypothetical protein
MDFVRTYFGWEPSVAQLIWAGLLAVVMRAFLSVRRRGWLENERLYWLVAPLAFLVILAALTYAAKGAQPQQWPPALTQTEIGNWSLALKPYHVSNVSIGFADSGQKDFVATIAQGMSEAGWSEPSLQPFQYSVGVRIIASQDEYETGQQLQQLCKDRIGRPVRLDKANPDHPGTIVIYTSDGNRSNATQ